MVLQITASVTFLPLLNDRCSFDLLVYTDAQSAVPLEWLAYTPCHCDALQYILQMPAVLVACTAKT